MRHADVPAEGELRIGSVTLPLGQRILAGYGSDGPVAWATNEPVRNAGAVWLTLSKMSSATGLVPFLLATLEDEDESWEGPVPGELVGRPWSDDEFGDPLPIAGLDDVDVEGMLRRMWDDAMPTDEEDTDDWRNKRSPFSREFPGLAEAQRLRLTEQQLHDTLMTVPSARIGVAPAGRSADVLPLIGWQGTCNRYRTSLPVAAVLRSWEGRFGAELLQIGFAQIRLLATRPPRTLEVAEHLAAELSVFCDEFGGFEGLREVSLIAQHLLESPIWTLWWD